MSFFRNPEIQKSLIFYILLILILTIAGFLLGYYNGLIVLTISILFTFLHFLITFRRYKKLAELGSDIDRILHGDDSIDLAEYSEGEMSFLQSEISKLTVQLRNQAWALKKDKQYLADSIADISHQIRTPLTSINIMLSLLSKPDLPEERKTALFNELETLLGRIDWLITTLLKISRLDTGTVKFKKEKIMVSRLISLAVAPIAISLELREQVINTEISGNESFTGDLSWTVEAIENILKNCMEHTQKGGVITITACETPLFTEIVIKDNGPGIDKEDLPHLFERFYKGKNSDSQNYGIGLALARMIIVNQNGTIKAENAPEGGAKFTIRFYKG
ncbi:MAG: HAMP domain-containing histidine kinase [Clostridiaceae bacterium]|nr:HAMP domain-containing histidine kinase [Clostridiaceae bacterium]